MGVRRGAFGPLAQHEEAGAAERADHGEQRDHEDDFHRRRLSHRAPRGCGVTRERLRRAVVLVAALVAVAVTARLGVWQLDRAAQKREHAAELAAREAAPPVAVGDPPL
ncbi:MAG: hypothetical protein HXY24_00100, partial [Rubrivivax sp.]|nr:hypothetical protein [Rubrivivax sp.]